ncbi:MAG TPA: YceI family protein [Rhizomicrobium sp.]|nr:YceI family protein [Rhizomicrobium sp.]
MRRLAVCLALVAVIGSASAAGVSTDPRSAPPGAYQMDLKHTQVVFAIRHLGITDYYGRFEKFSGTLNFNPAAPEKSAVDVSIDTSSVNVMSSEIMGELTGASVFDSAKFPKATFVSTALTRTGPDTGTMTGNLTLHGVTKPITMNVTFNGGVANPTSGGYAVGFHAETTIHRSDFGLSSMMWNSFVSDDVKLTIEAMFEQKKA